MFLLLSFVLFYTQFYILFIFNLQQTNPYGTTDQLTEEKNIQFRKQKILTMQEMLVQVRERNKTVLFDVRQPPESHPYFDEWLNVTLEAILDTGVKQDDVVRTLFFLDEFLQE